MQTIETKFLGPTNFRGARIKATHEGGVKSVTLPYPYELSGVDVHAVAAVALARQLDWHGTLIGGSTKRGYVFVFANDKQYEIDSGDIEFKS